MITEPVGAISLAIWIYLVFARGGFWHLRDDRSPLPEQAGPAPSVAVIIPARNEAEVVGHAVRSLLAQKYSGRTHIFLVDDESSDDTVRVVRQIAEHAMGINRVTVVQGCPVPDGWTGKLWAVSQGVAKAEAAKPKPKTTEKESDS